MIEGKSAVNRISSGVIPAIAAAPLAAKNQRRFEIFAAFGSPVVPDV